MPSFHPHLRGSTVRHQSHRNKRAGGGAEAWQLEDCMTVSSGEEGGWHYTSDGRAETCGLYLDAVKLALVLDLVVFQSVAMPLIYLYRWLTTEEGEKVFSELRPRHGEYRPA